MSDPTKPELIFDKGTIKRLTKRSLWIRLRLLFVRRKNIVTGIDLVDGVVWFREQGESETE